MYPLNAAIVVHSRGLWEELEASLRDLPVRIVMEQAEIADLDALVNRLERLRPDVVFLELSGTREPLDTVIGRIRTSPSAPAVLVLNQTADSAAILAAMRAGAAEYLYPPIQEQARAALERIADARQATHHPLHRGGGNLGFLSAKGGCGATTIACHTAIELPKVSNSKVLLADLDVETAMAGFLLKTPAKYSVADAAVNTDRLDENYWKALVTNGIPGMEVIAAPPHNHPSLKPEQLRFVLSFARAQYDWVVLDLGRGLNATALAALEEVDKLFLVATLEVPALHHAKLMVERLLNGGYPAERLHLLLNRAPKRFDVTMRELESMLGAAVYAVVPNDYTSLHDCYSEGTMLPGGSNLGRHFSSLARKLAGIPEPVVPQNKLAKTFAKWTGA